MKSEVCEDCGKLIEGYSLNQVKWIMTIHKASKQHQKTKVE